MKFHATVYVTRRKAILDPEGKAIEHALQSLEYAGCANVRVGRMITFDVEAPGEAEARELIDTASEKLLSNPIMEDFTFTLQQKG
jgi:phosphoribosylformylglycinamidine synthase